jgi:hypothetical protein
MKKILIISAHTFDIFGGYEKVLITILKEIRKEYEIEILSAPFYKTLIKDRILHDFKDYKIYRFSDYKNKLHYRIHILIKKFFKKNLLINYKSLSRHLDKTKPPDIILITNPLLILTTRVILEKNKIDSKIVYWDHGTLPGYIRTKIERKNLIARVKGKVKDLIFDKEIFLKYPKIYAQHLRLVGHFFSLGGNVLGARKFFLESFKRGNYKSLINFLISFLGKRFYQKFFNLMENSN